MKYKHLTPHQRYTIAVMLQRQMKMTVIYTVMGCCMAVGVNMYDWLVYFLNHVHEYDNDCSRDLAELLPERIKDKLQTQ